VNAGGRVGERPVPPAAGAGRRDYLWELLAALWPPPAQLSRPARLPVAAGRSGALDFLVFPHARNPVLLVPLRPRRATSAALRGYKASGGRRDRLRFGLAAAAAAAGLGRLAPDRIRIEQPPGTPAPGSAGPAADIAGYLRSVLGAQTLVALHIGAPRANRKPVLQAITPGGELAGFVKVSLNPLTTGLVRAEAAALEFLAGVPLARLGPPRLLHHGRWRGHEVLVQEAFRPARPARSVADLTGAMTELAQVRGVSRLPLAGSPYSHGLRSRLSALPRPELAGPLLSALGSLEAAAGGAALTFGSWHGDWTPWNMTMARGRALVWDWERFATGVPVGYDAVHYRLQGDIIRGGSDPAAAAEALLAGAAGILAPFGIEPDAAGLVAALYLTELAARYLSEGQAEAGARLGRVDAWLLPALTRCAQRPGGLTRR
jgi:hypothetical protein